MMEKYIWCGWKILESNIRRRGEIGGSAKKVCKRIKELERLYGIEKGNNQFSLPNSSVSSQSDLAAQMGISLDTLQNYKMLADMIPELDELLILE
jgi:ParB family chromosome partitioning protein